MVLRHLSVQLHVVRNGHSSRNSFFFLLLANEESAGVGRSQSKSCLAVRAEGVLEEGGAMMLTTGLASFTLPSAGGYRLKTHLTR